MAWCTAAGVQQVSTAVDKLMVLFAVIAVIVFRLIVPVSTQYRSGRLPLSCGVLLAKRLAEIERGYSWYRPACAVRARARGCRQEEFGVAFVVRSSVQKDSGWSVSLSDLALGFPTNNTVR